MKFEEREESGVMVVRPLENRLDAYVAEEFKAHMAELVRNGHLQLVIDLSDVEFVDSSGLGAIIAAMLSLRARGQLMVCSAGENVLALFRLTRMDRVIPVMADADAALRALAGAE